MRKLIALSLMLLMAFAWAGREEDFSNGQAAHERSDYATAAKWYRKAAEQEHAPAQTRLGTMYRDGQGVPQDHSTAAKWYRQAAELGYAPGQNYLGMMYSLGQGVPQDFAAAAKWNRKAGEQGWVPAQDYLGTSHILGQGVPQDQATAAKWLRMAAEQGYPPAQNSLGFMYEKGAGVPQDHAEAVRWYRKAAEQGHPKAQKQLRRLTSGARATESSPGWVVQSDAALHVYSGLSFASEWNSFRRVSTRTYDEKGHNVSVAYQHPDKDLNFTFYVYPKDFDCLPDPKEQFIKAVQDVRGVYPDMTIEKSIRTQIPFGSSTTTGYMAFVRWPHAKVEKGSLVVLIPSGDRFFKVRETFLLDPPDESYQNALSALNQFLQSLQVPLAESAKAVPLTNDCSQQAKQHG